MDYNKARPNVELLSHFYRYGALALTKVQPRTVFCADTKEMAAAFGSMIGREVVEVSVAMEPPRNGPLVPHRLSEHPVVVYQGHMSQLKGFHLLPETILTCSKQISSRPHFVVQVQSRAQTKLLPVVQWLERQPASHVRLVEGALSAEEYFEMMQQAEIVLLPYSLSYYGHCSSGVFAEAAALGKVIVVPEGTVAARQGREFDLGVVAAKTWNGAGLAEAIAEALRRWEELQAKALAGAEAFRRSQSVETFWESLLAALRMDVATAGVR
jgi:glycosyltransferase involved in cell wall biosynthesis